MNKKTEEKDISGPILLAGHRKVCFKSRKYFALSSLSIESVKH